jgi:hypothetical protein
MHVQGMYSKDKVHKMARKEIFLPSKTTNKNV